MALDGASLQHSLKDFSLYKEKKLHKEQQNGKHGLMEESGRVRCQIFLRMENNLSQQCKIIKLILVNTESKI